MTSQGWRSGVVAAAATLFLSCVFFLGPLTDDDLSLHIGMVSATDPPPMYRAGPDAPYYSPYEVPGWLPHEHLFSFVVWALHLSGTGKLIALRFCGWGLLLALLVHAGSPPSRGALYYVGLVAGLLAGAPLWTLRPHLVMLLGIVLTVLVARRESLRWWHLALLAGFYLLWTNMHASVFIGLGVWALFRWSNWRFAPGKESCRLALLAAVTLLNPAGWRLWLWPLRFLGESKGAFVSEWGPIGSVPLWPHVAFFLAFTAILGFALVRIRRERPYPWPELFLWAGFTLYALISRRMVAPAVAGGLLALGGCVGRDRFWQWHRDKPVRELTILLVLALAIIGSWWHPAGKRPFPDPALIPPFSPWGIRPLPPGKLFHPYEWGGILMMYGNATFIDGRTEAFSPEHLANYGTLYYCGPGWQELMKRYDIRGVWLPPDAPLARAVASDTAWTCEYASPAAVYYLRAGR